MFDDMEFSVDNAHRFKTPIHIVQAVFIFIAWAIEISLFRSPGTNIGGGDIYFFLLCFFSIPALIYQTLTFIFPKSRKWANAYAFAGVDIVLTILWLAAFAAVAAWDSSGGCGPDYSCHLGSAVVGLGFFICVFWGLTAAISIYGVFYFRRNGTIPGIARAQQADINRIDPDIEAFSTEPHDEYAPLHLNDKDDQLQDMHTEMGEGEGSGRYEAETSYTGAGGAGYNSQSDIGGYHNSSQSSVAYQPHDAYQQPYVSQEPERAQFPHGNY